MVISIKIDTTDKDKVIVLKNDIVKWIAEWFDENGKDCNAVVGISGGKDSSVVAALCAEALGNNRVIGVLMPNGYQADLDDAVRLCEFLNIQYTTVNIQGAYYDIIKGINTINIPTREKGDLYMKDQINISEQTKINLAPRIRMATLYAVSQSMNGRVANTCNYSEEYIGYSTRWGDSVGDFSPIGGLTTDAVVAIGDILGLPYDLVHKTPSDGLCGKTDEENFGFTYDELNQYIQKGYCNEAAEYKIRRLHNRNLFKRLPIPTY